MAAKRDFSYQAKVTEAGMARRTRIESDAQKYGVEVEPMMIMIDANHVYTSEPEGMNRAEQQIFLIKNEARQKQLFWIVLFACVGTVASAVTSVVAVLSR